MHQRITWIDMARGLAMMAILLFHTEVYYTGDSLIPYGIYVEDALALFFFISGYLFAPPGRAFSARHKLLSVSRRLVVPYALFCLAMALPKAVAHGRAIDVGTVLKPILSGDASWFVAALVVAEVYYTGATAAARRMACGHGARLAATTMLAIVPFALHLWVGGQMWHTVLGAAAMALVFMHAGHVSAWIGRSDTVRKPALWHDGAARGLWLPAVSAVALAALKVYENATDAHLVFYYIDISSYPLFMADCLLACVTVAAICRWLPGRWLGAVCWTGRHSLPMYFLSGAIPFAVARVLPAYNGCYLMVLVAFGMVWALAAASAWAVYRYLPWAVGG